MKYKKSWNLDTKMASYATRSDGRAASLIRIYENLQNMLIISPTSLKPSINQTLISHDKSKLSLNLQITKNSVQIPYNIIQNLYKKCITSFYRIYIVTPRAVLSWDGTWDMDVLGTGCPGHVYNFYMSRTYLEHFLFKL